MILQTLDSTLLDSSYPEAIKKALSYLRNTDFSSLEDGEYELDGRDVYARVFRLENREMKDSHPEYHDEYIDIQYWLSGSALMGWLARRSMDYELFSAEGDLFLLKDDPAEERFIEVRKGDYMILFPSDIHRPDIKTGESDKCRKVVIKVRVNKFKEN